MLEDEDDKIRRNLVTFSAAIITLTFLDIQPTSILNEVLKSTSIKISSWKVLMLAFLLETYLFYRFQTSMGKGVSAGPRPKFMAICKSHWEKNVERYVLKGLRRSLSKAIVSPQPLFKGYSPLAEAQKLYPDLAGRRFADLAGNVSIDPGLMSGRIIVTAEFSRVQDKDKRGALSIPMPVDFELHMWHLPALAAATIVQSLVTTNEGIDNNFPRAIALLSIPCLIWQAWKMFP